MEIQTILDRADQLIELYAKIVYKIDYSVELAEQIKDEWMRLRFAIFNKQVHDAHERHKKETEAINHKLDQFEQAIKEMYR